MASNVTVAYQADVTDLRTKSALVKAELADVNASIREQASAFAELSKEQKGPALAALQELTHEQKHLQEELSRTTAAIKKDAAAAEEHAGAFSHLHESVKLTGEGFEHLSASIGVWTGAFAAFGELAAVGFGLERISESIGKYTEGAESMAKLSAATGLTTKELYGLQLVATNTSTPFETVEGDLTKLTRAMQEAATSAESGPARAFHAMGIEVVDVATGKLRPMSAILDEVAAKLASYKDGTGKAALELQLFGRSATELTTFLNELGKDGLQFAADRASNLHTEISGPAIQAAIQYQEKMHLLSEEMTGFGNTIMSVVVPALNQALTAMAPNLDEQIADVKDQLAGLEGKSKDVHISLLGMIPGFGLANMFGVSNKGAEELEARLKALEAEKARLEGITAKRDAPLGGVKPPQSQEAPTFSDKPGDQVKQWKDQLLELQAVDGKFHAMSASAEAAFWQSKIALTKQGTDAQREVLTEFENASRRAQSEGARASNKAIRDEWETYSAGIREKIDADRGHLDQQIALATAWVAKAKELYKVDSKQYDEALKEKNDLDRQQLDQNLALAMKMAEAHANLDKIGEGSAKSEFKPSASLAFDSSGLDAQVAAQIAQLKKVLDEQLAALAMDEKGRINLGDTVAAATDYTDATAKLQAYIEKVSQLNQQAAQAVQDSWTRIGAPIEGALGKIAGAAIGGGRNSALAMEKAAVSILQSWARTGIQMLAHWVATQLGMTAATAAGSAARVVAATPEEAAMITQLAAMLGKHITVEAAKTGATVTGVAVRTSAEAAGAATSKAAAASAGASTVMSAAAKAAAGAYSSVAQIPYVGWILAPVAAAAAFVAVGAYSSMASAEGGWDSVPYDGVMTELHKNEMVLPANLADSVRNMANARNAPTPASAGRTADGGSSPTINNMGGNSHSAQFSQTNHFHGGENEASKGMADRSAEMVHGNLQHWYGNTGHATLPGRQVRR